MHLHYMTLYKVYDIQCATKPLTVTSLQYITGRCVLRTFFLLAMYSMCGVDNCVKCCRISSNFFKNALRSILQPFKVWYFQLVPVVTS